MTPPVLFIAPNDCRVCIMLCFGLLQKHRSDILIFAIILIN